MNLCNGLHTISQNIVYSRININITVYTSRCLVYFSVAMKRHWTRQLVGVKLLIVSKD